MRRLAILALALFVGALYLPPFPTSWTHRQLPSCYYRATWLGARLGMSQTPRDFATEARACFAARGGYLIGGGPPANFVVLKEWPQ